VLFTPAQSRKVAIAHVVVIFAALALSTVYWKWLGLM
jgi:hypothetical protein